MHSVVLGCYFMLAQQNTPLHLSRTTMVSSARLALTPWLSTCPTSHISLPLCHACRFPLVLDSTPPRSAPSSPSASASEAAHDDVDKRDTSADDSLKDRTDAVNHGHDAGADGLED